MSFGRSDDSRRSRQPANLSHSTIRIVSSAETLMAITISNLTASDNVPAGTTIGVLTATDASGTVIPSNYTLTKGSIGYFAIAGNYLVTAWSVPATPGHYSVRIRAIGLNATFSGSATFTVDGGMAAPPPPPPPPPSSSPSIQINGSASPVTVSAGATISATVANGPGNPGDWLGVYAVGAPTGGGNPPSWKWLSTDDAGNSVPPAPGITAGTAHLVVPEQAGQYEVRFFLNNSFTLGATSAAITVQIAAPPPPAPVPSSVTLNPASVSLPDNSAAGTPVSTAAVAMSDGSAFAGMLTIGVNNMVALSGLTVALTRALTAADDGAQSFMITAAQNAGTASATLALNVTAVVPPPPTPSPAVVITVTPNAPQMPDTTPVGAVVATYSVTMSDGSPFMGTISFGPPNFDDGSVFSLTGSPTSGNIIVNPSGPGIGPNLSTITDHITLLATQP